MSTIFVLLILLGFVLLVVTLLGMFLPNAWQIEKAELIHASPAELFQLINFLNKWPEWSVWNNENDDRLDFEYKGPDGGLGAIQIWADGPINGQLTITRSVLDKELQYQFEIDGGKFIIIGTIVLAVSAGGYTQLAWRCQLNEIKGSNPITRYQAYFLQNYFNTTIEESLENLKSLYLEEEEATEE